jgi:predicted HTH domain antitoxin
MSEVKLDVKVPEELLDLLGRSKLSARDRAGQVRAALAIHLLLAGEISGGKAAELAGQRRADFEDLLRDLGLPLVAYDREEFQRDRPAIEALERRRKSG